MVLAHIVDPAGVFGVPDSGTPTAAIDEFSWRGCDGVRWDLLDSGSPVVVLMDGVTGLHDPPLSHHTTTVVQGHGARWRGWRASQRDVSWTLGVREREPGSGYSTALQEFLAGVRPDQDGVWTVKAPGIPARSLRCRLTSDGSYRYDRNPETLGYAKLVVTMVALQPFWAGGVEGAAYAGAVDYSWLPTSTRPSFYIGPNNTLGETTLTNPGEVEVSPRWTIHGPCSSINLQIRTDSRTSTIAGPVALTAGQSIVVDPTADGGALRNDGVDVTAQFTSWGSTKIPPGQSATATLEVDGGGSLSVELTPLFLRGLG